MTQAFEPEPFIAATRIWLIRAVLGLNLCPFAAVPFRAGLVHIVASDAQSPGELLDALGGQMLELSVLPADERETTLLVHPLVMLDFLEFNDFLDAADALLVELDLEGVLQVASFHPDYQFADTTFDDVANCTNRSPYPTLHLLREASVTRAVGLCRHGSDLRAQHLHAARTGRGRLGAAMERAMICAWG